MIALRNIAIVALLAAGVAFLPGGGRVTEAVFELLSMAFLTVLALAAWRFLSSQEFTLLAMPDRRRAGFLAAIGLGVLTIAGTSSLWASGLGTLLWLILIGTSAVAIWRIWMAEKAI